MKRFLLGLVVSFLVMPQMACIENNIMDPQSVERAPAIVLSAATNPVMYVHPSEYFQNSVTVVAPIGITPRLGFGISGVQMMGGDLVNYGAVGCIENCKTHTWKWTLYFVAPPTEGSFTGTFQIEGTDQKSLAVIHVSFKG
jgi:hypothetical protein